MGPFDRPEVAYTVPEILEPAKFKQLLATAEEEVPELIPFLAMAGFAGLRRSELVREYAKEEVLRWEDINWQKQLITVRHEVAKQWCAESLSANSLRMARDSGAIQEAQAVSVRAVSFASCRATRRSWTV